MTLPKRLKIGKRWWKIEAVEGRIPFGDGYARGLCHYEERLIQVNVKQSRKMVLSTLFHEIAHAWELEGLRLSHEQIYALETVQSDLFLRNPALVLLLSALLPRGRSST